VETIVAIAVGAIVMAAIFPIFLLLYRVETTWGAARQARASGLIAESSLNVDARAYELVCAESGVNSLVLRAVGTDPYRVTYSVKDSNLYRIVTNDRALADPDVTVFSRAVVAHGVARIEPTVCSQSMLQLSILTKGLSGREVRLEPDLIVCPRNAPECPPR
jgi:hypothetical protein